MSLATKAKINTFIDTGVGKKFNPDHAFGFQCKDVIDAYGEAIFGVRWQDSVKPADAKDLFEVAPSAFWDKIKNDPSKKSQLPVKGDVLVWSYWPYGHTGIVVDADEKGVTILQQDGILQTPAHRKYYNWNWKLNSIKGWLRPKQEVVTPRPSPRINKKGTATVTYAGGMNVRDAASTKGKVLATYAKGEKFNYDSYIDTEGYRWLSYIAAKSKKRVYIAQRKGNTNYVSGGVK